MRWRQVAVLWLLPVLSPLPAAEPAGPQVVSREVSHLLRFVADSDCMFYRNGSWYAGRQASEHLQTKYTYLQQRQQIATTEDFIVRAATRSSISGELYKVRCGAGAEKPADGWLSDELSRYRATTAAAGAAHSSRNGSSTAKTTCGSSYR